MLTYCRMLIVAFLFFGCNAGRVTGSGKPYQSEKLVIKKIAPYTYLYTSFLQTESWGKVDCNGVLFFDGKEAIVFNTPTDDSGSSELINYVEQQLQGTIKAVIPSHFHGDGIGGLNEFHKHKIPSYAYNRTIEIARSKNLPIPQNGFDSTLELNAGSKKIIAAFIGEGHTKDNIIGYFPEEKVLFGGCLIKEVAAEKGYLGDANLKEWPSTVIKLKGKYPDAKIMIPGHGKFGGTALLDYTIRMFQ